MNLADLDVEQHGDASLSWWRQQDDQYVDIYCAGPSGAIQMHAPTQVMQHVGGIEIHSAVQLHEWDPDPDADDCPLTGGLCWVDGVGDYTDRVHPMVQAGDAAGVAAFMRQMYRTQLQEREASP